VWTSLLKKTLDIVSAFGNLLLLSPQNFLSGLPRATHEPGFFRSGNDVGKKSALASELLLRILLAVARRNGQSCLMTPG
jgi:hypothetical protein